MSNLDVLIENKLVNIIEVLPSPGLSGNIQDFPEIKDNAYKKLGSLIIEKINKFCKENEINYEENLEYILKKLQSCLRKEDQDYNLLKEIIGNLINNETRKKEEEIR